LGFPQNPRIIIAVKVMIKLKNLLYLGYKMAWDHSLKMRTPHNIYLFMASCNSKCTIYIVETEAIIASKGEEVLLSWLQNIAETTPPVRNKGTRKKNKKLITLIHCE
jgi:hypothetical protein